MTHAQLYESCIITLEGSLAMERGAYYNGDEFSTEADKITQYIIKNRCGGPSRRLPRTGLSRDGSCNSRRAESGWAVWSSPIVSTPGSGSSINGSRCPRSNLAARSENRSAAFRQARRV